MEKNLMREKLKNKVIQREEFNVKRYSRSSFQSPGDGLLKPKRYKVYVLLY